MNHMEDPAHIERLAPDLVLIDTHYRNTPRSIASYLLLGDRPGLIETGPTSTIDALLDGVRAAGLDAQDLRAVAVTHIHLDHAGAAGVLAHRIPHLQVYVHPVGAPHLADPTRLVASARRLYGDTLEPFFGEILPVPADRVHVLHDGDQFTLGSRNLTAVDTPGHARHHHAYWDDKMGDLFTGDVAGVAMPGSKYLRVPTPPPELDVPAWLNSIARMRALAPRRLLLTHFGPVTWGEELLDRLERALPRVVALVEDAVDAGLDETAILQKLQADARQELRAYGDGADHYEVVMPIDQSALGLIRYVTRLRAARAPAT